MTRPTHSASEMRVARAAESLLRHAAVDPVRASSNNSPARYELRTSGPDATARNPIARASSAHAANCSGGTNRSTGRNRSPGRPGARYWPSVSMSTSASRSCRIASVTSSSVSPRPTMMLLLVHRSGRNCFRAPQALASFARTTPADRAPARSSRGTHSTLCANTASGMPSSKCRSAASSPAKSLDSSSIVTCGSRSCTA